MKRPTQDEVVMLQEAPFHFEREFRTDSGEAWSIQFDAHHIGHCMILFAPGRVMLHLMVPTAMSAAQVDDVVAAISNRLLSHEEDDAAEVGILVGKGEHYWWGETDTRHPALQH